MGTTGIDADDDVDADDDDDDDDAVLEELRTRTVTKLALLLLHTDEKLGVLLLEEHALDALPLEEVEVPLRLEEPAARRLMHALTRSFSISRVSSSPFHLDGFC